MSPLVTRVILKVFLNEGSGLTTGPRQRRVA
jgi:hypothetical protein